MSETLLATKPAVRAVVRKAAACIETPEVDAEQGHRAGHQSFVNYRLQEITGEKARGVGGVPGIVADRPEFARPWHYHECDFQLSIVLEGSAEIGFSDETFFRVGKGEVALIPGHVMHDVRQTSADYNVIELTFPGSFTTIIAPAPPAGTPTEGAVWGPHDAVRTGCERGVATYAYPMPASCRGKLTVERQWRTRLDPFEAGSLRHDDPFHLLLVMEGSRDIEIEGETVRLGVNDLMMIPRGAECRDLAASEGHMAILLKVLT
jgi:mannose-6-phosphate isomerase-like protein (cupin superfamily)